MQPGIDFKTKSLATRGSLAAVARLDRPKLVPTLLVHKCSCGIVIAYDAEEVEWAVARRKRSLAMTTPDDGNIASLAEVCSAGALAAGISR